MKTNLDSTFGALADPTRRGIIDLLRERPHCAGELATAFDMSAPAMSRHLRVLRTRGLVEEQRAESDARLRVFRLRRQPFTELSEWLTRVEEFWSERLDSSKFTSSVEGRPDRDWSIEGRRHD